MRSGGRVASSSRTKTSSPAASAPRSPPESPAICSATSTPRSGASARSTRQLPTIRISRRPSCPVRRRCSRPFSRRPDTDLHSQGSLRSGDPVVDLDDGLAEHRPAGLVGRGGELAIELRPREPQGLERAKRLRILHRGRMPFRSLAFEFLHAFVNPRLCIDQTFTSITHDDLLLVILSFGGDSDI